MISILLFVRVNSVAVEKFLSLFIAVTLNLSEFATILFSLNYFTADSDSSLFNFVIKFAVVFIKVNNVLLPAKLSTDTSLMEKSQ